MCCGEGARRCVVDKTLYRRGCRGRTKPTREERQKSANPSHSNQQFPVSFDDRLLIVKQTKAVEETLAVITGLSYPEC